MKRVLGHRETQPELNEVERVAGIRPLLRSLANTCVGLAE